MRLKYSAWLREQLGCAAEDIVLPPQVTNVGQLLAWLPTRGERFAQAFEFIDVVLVSVNRRHAEREQPLRDEDEVILAPPIAGG